MRVRGRHLTMLAISITLAVFALAAQAHPAGAETFEYLGAFGPDGTETGGFSGAGSVAVDQGEGFVYVLDGGHFEDGEAGALYKFDLEGNPVDFSGSSPSISGNKLSGIPIEGYPEFKQQVAVDSTTHTIYVTGGEGGPFGEADAILAYEANGEPSVFPATGTNEIVVPETPGAGSPSVGGVAVDIEGNIYVSDSNVAANSLFIYTRAGAPLISGAPSPVIAPTNLAADFKGDLYVTGSGEVVRLVPSEFPVSGSTTYANDGQLAAPNAVSVAVDPATNEVYVSQETGVSVFDQDKTLQATFGGSGESGELGGSESRPLGLAVDSSTERAFVAHRFGGDAGLYQVYMFQRHLFAGSPTVESVGVTQVTADSARLSARINPNTRSTTYWFEYGLGDCETSACTKVPLAGGSAGSGHQSVPVSQSIAGLAPETLYHYRVVAENELGATVGLDRTFLTAGNDLGFGLTDSRVWEMVSPPDKHGGVLALPTSGIIQAAENGDGLAYLSLGSIEEAPQGNRAVESSSVLAHRESDGDWNSKDITPPHVKATAVRDAEYKLMTPDLSRALLEARDEAPLSPWTTERTPYLRENTEPPQYTPLLTSAEGHANVPPGTEFGQSLDLMGATRDLSEVALRSKAPLVPGAEENSLYLWRAGQIKAVSKLPSTGGGGPNVVSGSLGSGVGSVRNAISDDGVRVFWAPGEGYSSVGIELPALYLYDTSAEESVRLDVPEAGASEEGETRPAFQGASADGTIVFFTDSQRLTKDASATGRDLYRCEIPSGTAMTGCASLIDVSAPPAGSGESANVKDQVLAISQDGRRIYFVAGGALDTRANQNGSSANTGEPNLYLWQEGDGVRFVATLSEGDAPDWGAGPTRVIGYSGRSSVGSSPSGRYLAFMSDRSLTGYDSRETSAAEAAEEVFRYDAVGEELLCVSCNASGANPQAVLMPNRIGVNKKVDTQGMWAERWVAATLPEARTEDFGDSFYRPRSVLENGRVFFNSYDSLVSADSNNEWDVYQYEPTSTGSCTAASRGPALARLPAGCVSLISSGTGDEEAAFLDASASGDDVFFLTAAALSALDEDDLYDAYDARVGGVVAERLPHSACSGDACQPAPQSPAASTPASFSFHGSGNLIASKCGEIVHRATRLRTRARALRRKAAGANSQVAMRMRRRATALSRKASRLSKRAKRCRRANRRATR